MYLDAIRRFVIRILLRQRLVEESGKELDLSIFREGPIAVHFEESKEQHYEVPTEFYKLVLGSNLKYSCSFFEDNFDRSILKSTEATRIKNALSQAESKMLEKTINFAEIEDGMKILDLGCGWGSLSLYLAKKFSNISITAVSHSATQREFIESHGYNNIKVITSNINDLNINEKFDRVVSVEMFEHMRNLESLFSLVSSLLAPNGLAVAHIFNHKKYAYLFETKGASNWMGRYFFTGGMMPSRELYYKFNNLEVIDRIDYSGINYMLTSELWLRLIDLNKDEVLSIFNKCYNGQGKLWFDRWRIFFLAVAELFGFKGGEEWGVSHYKFISKDR